MGTESGEELAAIVTRKEWERQLGQGTFFWGIGQSLGSLPEVVAEKMGHLPAIFSPMSSRPRAIDVTPGEIALWTASAAADGTITRLPVHALVTSRATLPSGKRKLNHYALACKADAPLTVRLGTRVYPESLTNYGTGRKLGGSQVTAIVDRTETGNTSASTGYPVAFVVELAAPYQLKLAEPRILSAEESTQIDNVSRTGDLAAWKALVEELRARSTRP
ncbi:hypothetical protein P0D73_15690 [Paraburkholderia sp. RL18-101-BIB-B]|uniref:hypothetical protein n=1 Tax=Paraburkholderia sp. RL18-101-BIB-B TaxID=3031634 RepID=UPI0038B8B6E5